MDRHVGSSEENSPIRAHERGLLWGIDDEAHELLRVADTPFPTEALGRVAKAGPNLVGKYEDVRMAARRIREIHMGTLDSQAQHARGFLR